MLTACGSDGSGTATVTNGNAGSLNRPSPTMAPSADKAVSTASPQGQNKAVPPAGNAPNSQIGSGGNDLFLFTKARSALDSDSDLKTAKITIEVKAGVVTLSGVVATAEQKSKAEQLVREAEGVRSVTNRLRIGK